jgi:hypothetical protein
VTRNGLTCVGASHFSTCERKDVLQVSMIVNSHRASTHGSIKGQIR